jgi:predicted acylesterase/phospholipase RssA
MSIAYPPIMTPVLYESDYYGDGGESTNYPLTLYTDAELTDAIGISFASFNENVDGTLNQRINISDVYDYVKSVCHTMNRATYISQLKPQHLARSIIIKIDKPIDCMNLDITNEEKLAIYECGVKAVGQIEQVLRNLV